MTNFRQLTRGVIFLVAGFFASSLSVLSAPTRYHVALAGNDGADGLSWATPLKTISAAVSKTIDGDTVMLSNGIFYLPATIEITNHITLTSTNGAALTTVDGSNALRVITMTASGATIDGLTIAHGNTNLNGAGIYLTNGTIRNCTFTSNAANFGSGVYMTGGVVTNCLFFKNPTLTGGGASGRGAGVYMTGGLVVGCLMLSNTSARAGTGICMTGGTVDRCLIASNSAANGGGGGIAIEGAGRVMNCLVYDNQSSIAAGGIYLGHAGASVNNCTLVGNQTGSSSSGGGLYRAAGSVTNTIVYYNRKMNGQDDNIVLNGAETFFRNCCSPDLTHDPGGTGNITTDPSFSDQSQRDFTLAAGSPCIDTGSNVIAITTDYAGAARPIDGDGDGVARHDIGALESPLYGTGPLSVNFFADTNEAPLTLQAILTAHPAGSDTNNLYYWWNLGNTTMTGYGQSVVTNSYTPGFYSVSLTVSNGSTQVDSVSKTDFIKVYAPTTYVATNGSNLSPYTTWNTAASNIQNAIDLVMTGGLVQVGPGTYSISNPVTVLRAITVQGTTGQTATVLEKAVGFNTRILNLSHASARVDGLILKGGVAPPTDDLGGGVMLNAGQLVNSTIAAGSAVYGAGIYMNAGVVSNCLLQSNATKGGGGGAGQGGGLYVNAGTVTHCRVISNTSVRAGSGVRMAGAATLRNSFVFRNAEGGASLSGGAVIMDAAGLVENCLIVGNTNSGAAGAGGLCINSSGARIWNCTITGNASTNVGGLRILAGSATNLIVWNNRASSGTNDIMGTNSIGYSCSADLTHDPAGRGNITNNPLFVDPGTNFGLTHATGNYHLAVSSPCRDKGLDQAGMIGGTDLDGGRRKVGTVDMGAYEALLPYAAILMTIF